MGPETSLRYPFKVTRGLLYIKLPVHLCINSYIEDGMSLLSPRPVSNWSDRSWWCSLQWTALTRMAHLSAFHIRIFPPTPLPPKKIISICLWHMHVIPYFSNMTTTSYNILTHFPSTSVIFSTSFSLGPRLVALLLLSIYTTMTLHLFFQLLLLHL